MMRNFLISGVFILLVSVVWAQDTRNVETRTPPRPQYQSMKKEKKGLFSFLKKKNGRSTRSEVQAFRTRVKKVYKKKARQEKRAERKPRYSEHSYFGHKRPPKKRPPGKQKFCKTCGIRH